MKHRTLRFIMNYNIITTIYNNATERQYNINIIRQKRRLVTKFIIIVHQSLFHFSDHVQLQCEYNAGHSVLDNRTEIMRTVMHYRVKTPLRNIEKSLYNTPA